MLSAFLGAFLFAKAVVHPTSPSTTTTTTTVTTTVPTLPSLGYQVTCADGVLLRFSTRDAAVRFIQQKGGIPCDLHEGL